MTVTINWQFVKHSVYAGQHQTMCRDNALGVQRERVGSGKWWYFIDGDPIAYRSEEELLDGLVCGTTKLPKGVPA